ncbi:rRNA pseudouridine synthase [candidate division KSB1 bacterium]|nr:rRNA pseudouridine synthase [candidate division KSB1 bacterium]
MNSFLSRAGIAARRKCDQLIKDGLVTVNGKSAVDPGLSIDSDCDTVKYRGKRIEFQKSFEYILFNKPKGVVCTAKDEKNRMTIFDIIKTTRRLFPVGRLDKSTTGLLLLTDDGDLSYKLSHPKYEINKVYTTRLNRTLELRDKKKLQDGVKIGKNEYVSAEIRSLNANRTDVEITVHEGKKNMIIRMFDAVGYKVVSLDRIKYAGLSKRKLPKSGWRYLTGSEVNRLFALTEHNRGH